jgi:hypothetical protein
MNAVDTILNYSLLLCPVNLFETLYHFTRHCCSIFKLLNLNLIYPSFEIRAICVCVCLCVRGSGQIFENHHT